MANPADLLREDLFRRFSEMPVGPEIARIYDTANPIGRAMAHFHERLNGLFLFMNKKATINSHYNANESRELLDLVDEINTVQSKLKRIGIIVEIRDDYRGILNYVSGFLARSGGSTIPNDFRAITVAEYEPVFTSSETGIELADRRARVQTKMIGEGSFALVFSYRDPEYGKKFAIKRARPTLSPQELLRFRQEFDILKRLSFPYILEVYRYSEERNDYTMEHCDSTLEKYIGAQSARLQFGTRRRIALQVLFALNYLHDRAILHRDISLRNILIKRYDAGAVVVKLSDFGLAKDQQTPMTKTNSETKGAIVDPTLESFKAYAIINEIYPVGCILSFIFSGRMNLDATTGEIRTIVDKCVTLDLRARYSSVRPIIRDIEALGGALEAPTEGSAS